MNLTPTPATTSAAIRPCLSSAALGHTQALAVGLMVLGLLGCSSEPSAPVTQKPKSALAGSSLPESTPAPTAAKPKSVFSLALKAARDPFFPESKGGSSKEAADSAPRPIAANALKLLGIRPGTQRPMALINRTPLGVGEEGEISVLAQNGSGKLQAQKISVRCLEIRRDSVLIQVAGEPGVKELRMAQAK